MEHWKRSKCYISLKKFQYLDAESKEALAAAQAKAAQTKQLKKIYNNMAWQLFNFFQRGGEIIISDINPKGFCL